MAWTPEYCHVPKTRNPSPDYFNRFKLMNKAFTAREGPLAIKEKGAEEEISLLIFNALQNGTGEKRIDAEGNNDNGASQVPSTERQCKPFLRR